MKYCMITFRSVTPAQRGESILRGAGLECSIQRTPRWMEEKGCGYSLHIRCQDAARCVELLRGAEVPLRGVYVRSSDKTAEELFL